MLPKLAVIGALALLAGISQPHTARDTRNAAITQRTR
jgi:hypothetical protein